MESMANPVPFEKQGFFLRPALPRRVPKSG
jgi:hypothetical protein